MEHFSFEQRRPQEATSSSQKNQSGYGEVSTKKTLKSKSRSCSGKKRACWKRVPCSKNVTQKSASKKWSSDPRCWTREESDIQTEKDKNKKFNAELSSLNGKMLRKEEVIEECKDAESESAKGKAARKAARKNTDCAAVARRSQGDQRKNVQKALCKPSPRKCRTSSVKRKDCEDWRGSECSDQVLCELHVCAAIFNILKEHIL